MKYISLSAVEEGHQMTQYAPSYQYTCNQDTETNIGQLVRQQNMKANVTSISKALWKHLRRSNYIIYEIRQDFTEDCSNELGFEE